jgi:hypothetical protein
LDGEYIARRQRGDAVQNLQIERRVGADEGYHDADQKVDPVGRTEFGRHRRYLARKHIALGPGVSEEGNRGKGDRGDHQRGLKPDLSG